MKNADIACITNMICYSLIDMKNRSDKRTSISLANVVWQMAVEMMQAKGFNDNFSSYVADLIRRDKEKQELAQRELAERELAERKSVLLASCSTNQVRRL